MFTLQSVHLFKAHKQALKTTSIFLPEVKWTITLSLNNKYFFRELRDRVTDSLGFGQVLLWRGKSYGTEVNSQCD
jgi:hypothetical protein